MAKKMTAPLHIIARAHTDFSTKFGIPRQSALLQELTAEIVFEPPFRNPDTLRGIEEFSHLWLIWEFSESARDEWSATVRPPKLGGNERRGVFATRSPFRPNPIGLSCVQLKEVRQDEKLGLVLVVSGADLMDQTPILDIKPYIPYCDCVPQANGGFGQEHSNDRLTVRCEQELLQRLPQQKRAGLLEVLACDPRPSYHNDPDRIYGFVFAGFEIHFRVENNTLTVCNITK